MADETGWICDQCNEDPWPEGEGKGLKLLQAGEECTCGGNYVEVPFPGAAWVWKGFGSDWVWRDGLNPEERDAAVKRYGDWG